MYCHAPNTGLCAIFSKNVICSVAAHCTKVLSLNISKLLLSVRTGKGKSPWHYPEISSINHKQSRGVHLQIQKVIMYILNRCLKLKSMITHTVSACIPTAPEVFSTTSICSLIQFVVNFYAHFALSMQFVQEPPALFSPRLWMWFNSC